MTDYDPNSRRANARALISRDRDDGLSQFRFIAGSLMISTLAGAGIGIAATTDLPQIHELAKVAIGEVAALIFKDVSIDPTIVIPHQGKRYLYTAKQIAEEPYFNYEIDDAEFHAGVGGAGGLFLGAIVLTLTSGKRRRKQQALLADHVITGTRIAEEEELSRMTEKRGGSHPLRLGTVAMPSSLETRHLAMLGTTGAGKTTALRQLLDGIESRGDAALVYDTSGEFIAHYYDPRRGDIILNPFDDRGTYWNPFDEIHHPSDCDCISRYLISESGSRERDVWLETSRILVANILRTLWQENKRTLPDLLDALQSKSRDDLERWLSHTSSARTFSEDADRATASVLFMLAKASNLLMFLRAAPREDEAGFSFKMFFAGIDSIPSRKPWIFVPRKENHFDAMKPLMSLWLECAASATLGLAPHPTRRLWFMLDELPDLPRVDTLARLLPEGRKFGASAILTFQAIGQMKDRYGADGAEAMLGCCNTKLFLQLVDPDSREWASETIGKCEVEIQNIADSLDPKTGDLRKTLSTIRQVRAAVLESDLRLPKHRGYLLFPDGLPVAKIRLTDDHIRNRGSAQHPAFIAADLSTTLWGGIQAAQQVKKDTPTPSLEGGPV